MKTLDPDCIGIRIGIQPKKLDPDPYQRNADLKQWKRDKVKKDDFRRQFLPPGEAAACDSPAGSAGLPAARTPHMDTCQQRVLNDL
jgi:hypothetical protein